MQVSGVLISCFQLTTPIDIAADIAPDMAPTPWQEVDASGAAR